MKLWRSIDKLGVAAAALYALPTITYPLGRDLALFLYVGERWLHGRLPYRDTYDFKPPGIYVVNAITAALFGESQWGVHVVDIAAVLTMSWVVVHAVLRDRPRRQGELAAVALVVAGFYYTTFDFIEVAQTELWESLALIGAYAVAARARPGLRAWAAAGILVGMAVLFKPTGLLLGLVPATVVALRAGRAHEPSRGRVPAILRALVAFALGGMAVGCVVVGYFAVQGGLDAMIDIVIRHVWDYHGRASFAPVDRGWVLHKLRREPWTFFFFGAWVFAVVSAVRRRSWRAVAGCLAALSLVLLSIAAVVYQRRFLGYYWVVTTPFLALGAAHAVAELRRPAIAIVAVLGVIAIGLRYPPALPRPYRQMASSFVDYARGRISRAEYLAPFEQYPSEERLGEVIRSRARPGDGLMVRGYEPALYIVSGLECPSRFAVEIPFVTTGMIYKREEWHAEHERDVWNPPVRFAVTFADAIADIEGIRARGYREIARSDLQVVLERDP